MISVPDYMACQTIYGLQVISFAFVNMNRLDVQPSIANLLKHMISFIFNSLVESRMYDYQVVFVCAINTKIFAEMSSDG